MKTPNVFQSALESGDYSCWVQHQTNSADARIDCKNSVLSDSVLKRWHFTQIDFRNSHFSGVDFSGSAFSKVSFQNCTFQSCHFDGCEIDHAYFASPAAKFFASTFDGAIFRKSIFDSNRFGDETSFDGAIFYDSTVKGCVFNKTNLRYCHFDNCNLTGCSFNGNSVVGISLNNTNVTALSCIGMDFSGARSIGSVFVDVGDDGAIKYIDNIETGQIISLLMTNPLNMRNIISSLKRDSVLLLGGFDEHGLSTLHEMQSHLANCGKIGHIFEFSKDPEETYTGVVTLLSSLCEFTIAVVGSGASVPQELQAIVPHAKRPIFAVKHHDNSMHSMGEDFLIYPWFYPTILDYGGSIDVQQLVHHISDVFERWRSEGPCCGLTRPVGAKYCCRCGKSRA